MSKLCRHRRARAFTLVETVIASLIVAVLFAAALSTYAAASAAQVTATDLATGHVLAQELLDEIQSKAYRDPQAGATFGIEPDETGTAGRTGFDDVDDYLDYVESPIIEVDGTTRAELGRWSRRVQVLRVTSDSLNADANAETGLKRIVVRVFRDGRQVARMAGLKVAGG